MKKLLLVLVFISLVGLLAFGDDGEREEIDFLLFLPNSANLFVNEVAAMIQLDRTANYLMSRNLSPGKISVYGYAAAAANDIEPVNLSRDRAQYVINELKKRGVEGDLFAEPVACGPVDLWGGNTDEENRKGNRRARILWGNTILTQAGLRGVEIRTETPGTGVLPEVKQREIAAEKTGAQFPWWIIPLALIGIAAIAAAVFIASRRGRSSRVISAAIPAVSASPQIYILEEEEIRSHAYELYQQRNSQNGNTTEDWYRSMHELENYYEAQGYLVVLCGEMQALSA